MYIASSNPFNLIVLFISFTADPTDFISLQQLKRKKNRGYRLTVGYVGTLCRNV